MNPARKKAEACFALARSTQFEGERANAIAQGTRIAEGAGLSLDLFDIPGRVREAFNPGPRMREQHGFAFRPARPNPAGYSDEDLARFRRNFEAHMATDATIAEINRKVRSDMKSALNAFRESLKSAETRAGARPGESAYDARRRNFEDACADARQRDAAKAIDEQLRVAALAVHVSNRLWAVGWMVYRDRVEGGGECWRAIGPNGETHLKASDGTLCGIGLNAGVIDDLRLDVRGATDAR